VIGENKTGKEERIAKTGGLVDLSVYWFFHSKL
jgi:hypothetical protein